MAYYFNGKKRRYAYYNGEKILIVTAYKNYTTVEIEENASGITYKITTDRYTFENGVLTIGE